MVRWFMAKDRHSAPTQLKSLKKGCIRDWEGNYDIDGVSLDRKYGVVVSSDNINVDRQLLSAKDLH